MWFRNWRDSRINLYYTLGVMQVFSHISTIASFFEGFGELSVSYYYLVYSSLFLSLVALPIGYALLCHKMNRSMIPKPPTVPFFCIFGTVGGFLLVSALSPSIVTLLVIPLFVFAPISLIGSLVYLFRCRPLTSYHVAAVWCCVLLFVLPFLIQFLIDG